MKIMNSKFLSNSIVGLLIVITPLLANASDWYEFWVNQTHAYFDQTTPFSARISFTSERAVPTIGMEQGGTFAGKLFIELFTLERPGHCPRVGLSLKSSDASELTYEVPLTYEASSHKCYGEVSEPENEGQFSPGGGTTHYFQNPIYLTVGKTEMAHKLYVQDMHSYREFNFTLGEAVR